MDYDAMTIEELEGAIAEINAERAALKQKAVAIHGVLDAKSAQAAAAKKLASMSDAERAAMAQMISAQGVPSAGAIGVI